MCTAQCAAHESWPLNYKIHRTLKYGRCIDIFTFCRPNDNDIKRNSLKLHRVHCFFFPFFFFYFSVLSRDYRLSNMQSVVVQSVFFFEHNEPHGTSVRCTSNLIFFFSVCLMHTSVSCFLSLVAISFVSDCVTVIRCSSSCFLFSLRFFFCLIPEN